VEPRLPLALKHLMPLAVDFGLGPERARWHLLRLLRSLSHCKTLASQYFVHMSAQDIQELEPGMHALCIEGARCS
jgi:hypothetical protein